MLPIPTAAFLVQSGEHDWVLIDTGTSSSAWQKSFRQALKSKLCAAEDKLQLVLCAPVN